MQRNVLTPLFERFVLGCYRHCPCSECLHVFFDFVSDEPRLRTQRIGASIFVKGRRSCPMHAADFDNAWLSGSLILYRHWRMLFSTVVSLVLPALDLVSMQGTRLDDFHCEAFSSDLFDTSQVQPPKHYSDSILEYYIPCARSRCQYVCRARCLVFSIFQAHGKSKREFVGVGLPAGALSTSHAPTYTPRDVEYHSVQR